MERQPPVRAAIAADGGHLEDRAAAAGRAGWSWSAAASSPILISLTRSKPWVMTSMLELTTASPSLPNFFTYCLHDDVAVLLLGDAELLQHGADGEEGAEEGVALHAELEVGAVGGLAGDFEAGQREDANVLLDDLLAGPEGKVLPGALAFGVGLPDQSAAVLDAVERVGVGEGLGIAAEDDGDVAQIAVDADAVFGGDHEVAGGRALLFRAVLGVGADVDDFLGIAVVVDQAVALVEQVVEVAEDGAEVLAGGDGAPSADGVEADGDCAFGEQGRHFVADDRVGMVDAEDEEADAVGRGLAVFAGAAGGGEFVGADDVFGAEVARAEAVGAGIDVRHFVHRQGGQAFEAGCPAALNGLESAVRMSRPSGLSPAEGFVGALEDDDVLLALERGDDGRLGEGADDVDVDGADFGAAGLAEVVDGGFDVFGGGAEGDEDGVGVVASCTGRCRP